MKTIHMRTCGSCHKVDAPIVINNDSINCQTNLPVTLEYFCPDCIVDRVYREVFRGNEDLDHSALDYLTSGTPIETLPVIVSLRQLDVVLWRSSYEDSSPTVYGEIIEMYPAPKYRRILSTEERHEFKCCGEETSINGVLNALRETLRTLKEDDRFLLEGQRAPKERYYTFPDVGRFCPNHKKWPEKDITYLRKIEYHGIKIPSKKTRRFLCTECLIKDFELKIAGNNNLTPDTLLSDIIKPGTGIAIQTDVLQFALNNITKEEDSDPVMMFTISATELTPVPNALFRSWIFEGNNCIADTVFFRIEDEIRKHCPNNRYADWLLPYVRSDKIMID